MITFPQNLKKSANFSRKIILGNACRVLVSAGHQDVIATKGMSQVEWHACLKMLYDIFPDGAANKINFYIYLAIRYRFHPSKTSPYE